MKNDRYWIFWILWSLITPFIAFFFYFPIGLVAIGICFGILVYYKNTRPDALDIIIIFGLTFFAGIAAFVISMLAAIALG